MIPFPYSLIGVAIVASVAFFGGWKVQGWHRDSLEKERAEQKLADVRLSAAVSIRRADNVILAQNAAAARAAVARADADRARSELDGLRAASDAAVSAARASHEACVVTASAQSNVLKQCGESYRGLAEIADRHVNDIKTLTEAWPKE